MQWMGVASRPRGARGSPLFYQLHKTAPLLTITLRHYEANSQLAMHTQPQVQEPSAYWSLHFNPKKKKKKFIWNLETPSTMPRPMVHSTVQTMQILNDQLHKGDDKNKKHWTIKKECTNAYKWFRDDQCYQYYMALKIHIPGQVHTLYASAYLPLGP